MANFGWSYPPGCEGTPFDESGTCEVCGGNPDADPENGGCICPECPVCGEVGNQDCYSTPSPEGHGMVRTEEQIVGYAAMGNDDYDPDEFGEEESL